MIGVAKAAFHPSVVPDFEQDYGAASLFLRNSRVKFASNAQPMSRATSLNDAASGSLSLPGLFLSCVKGEHMPPPNMK